MYRFHQTVKGANDTKKVKTPCYRREIKDIRQNIFSIHRNIIHCTENRQDSSLLHTKIRNTAFKKMLHCESAEEIEIRL
jgi:hypothetical protein